MKLIFESIKSFESSFRDFNLLPSPVPQPELVGLSSILGSKEAELCSFQAQHLQAECPRECLDPLEISSFLKKIIFQCVCVWVRVLVHMSIVSTEAWLQVP